MVTEWGYWIRGWDGQDYSEHKSRNLYPCEDEADARKSADYTRSSDYTADVVVVKREIPDWEVTE